VLLKDISEVTGNLDTMIIYTKDGKEHRIGTGKPVRNTFFIDHLKKVIMRKDERAKPMIINQQQFEPNTLALLPPLPA
jgi:hypothetical protein